MGVVTIHRILTGFVYILGKIVVILMALLVLDVWLAILDRYVLHWQIIWTEPLARYIMMWAIFLSIPIIIVRREHIALTFLQDKLSQKSKILLSLAVNSMATIFYGFVAFYGVSFAQSGQNALSAFFDYPMSYAYYSIPVSFTLMTIASVLITVCDGVSYMTYTTDTQGT